MREDLSPSRWRAPRSILYVDPSSAGRKGFATLLDPNDLVTTVSNMQQCLSVLRRGGTSAVVIAWGGRHGGLPPTLHLRAESPHVPILLIADAAREAAAAELLWSGEVDELVINPTDSRILRIRLEQLCASAALRREQQRLDSELREARRLLQVGDARFERAVWGKREFENELRILTHAMDALTEALAVLDEDGMVLLVNAAWRRMAEARDGSLALVARPGLSYLEALNEAVKRSRGVPEAFADHLTSEDPVGTGAFAVECAGLDGSPAWYATRAFHFMADRRRHTVITIEEITHRRNLAEAHRQAQLQAVEASETRRRFLETMSHELRTPLNAVLGFAQLLQGDDLSSEQHELVQTIATSAQAIARQVDLALLLSRMPNPEPLEPSRSVVQSVVDRVVGQFDAAVRQRRLDVEIDVASDLEVLDGVDEDTFARLLANLLDGALQTAESEGRIRLLVVRTSSDRGVEIRISDEGQGLANEVLARSKQAPQSDALLRLRRSQSLAESLGGQLSVSSRLGEGTTLTVHIPSRPPSSGEQPAQQPTSPSPFSLTSLPRRLRAELRCVLVDADLDELHRVIAEIGEHDAVVAGQLSDLAARFEYDVMRGLCDHDELEPG